MLLCLLFRCNELTRKRKHNRINYNEKVNILLSNELNKLKEEITSIPKNKTALKADLRYAKDDLYDHTSYLMYLRKNLLNRKRYQKPRKRKNLMSQTSLYIDNYSKRIRRPTYNDDYKSLYQTSLKMDQEIIWNRNQN